MQIIVDALFDAEILARRNAADRERTPADREAWEEQAARYRAVIGQLKAGTVKIETGR